MGIWGTQGLGDMELAGHCSGQSPGCGVLGGGPGLSQVLPHTPPLHPGRKELED